MRIAIVGAGATGARAARQLASTEGVERIWIDDVDADRVRGVVASLGPVARAGRVTAASSDEIDVAVLALAAREHTGPAGELVDRGIPVVSVSDAPEDVDGLLGLDARARRSGVAVLAGAGFCPGLSCVLARHASSRFDMVDEIHVAKFGTGGPACARQHHRALSSSARDWRDGRWHGGAGGSGRQLGWFPDPVGPQDCYRAALADATLLHRAFPTASRVTARMSATRRDRLTARLPMLRPPHPEGLLGAIRVEVWGRRGRAREAMVYGSTDRPAVAAGAVAAVSALLVAGGGSIAPGAAGLAEVVEPVGFLHELDRRGIRAAVFEGAQS